MLLPQVNEVSAGKSTMVDFKGYNHKLFIADGEFYDMKNMTADYYPLLSPRKPRGTHQFLVKPNGLFAKEKLIWADGTAVYFDGGKILDVEDSSKQFSSMGAYLLVFPDKLYYNTADPLGHWKITMWREKTWKLPLNPLRFPPAPVTLVQIRPM